MVSQRLFLLNRLLFQETAPKLQKKSVESNKKDSVVIDKKNLFLLPEI